MKLDDVAVIVTTFLRERDCMKCLGSVRHFYSDIKILAADNGRHEGRLFYDFLKRMKIDHIMLPFNCGLSKTRNEALDKLRDYPYILLMEDDMEFIEESKIEKFKTVLEGNEDLALVAGGLEFDGGDRNLFSNRLEINKGDRSFYIRPIKEPLWIETGGVCWHYADYVYNFFMMRNEPDIRWDPRLKQRCEHLDFSIHIKQETNWNLAATPEVVCKHHPGDSSSEYWKHRGDFESWTILREKRGVDAVISEESKAVYDFKELRDKSYPEYIYGLFESINNFNKKGLATSKSFLKPIIRDDAEANPKRPDLKEA